VKIEAGSYSFVAANARHQHEWRVWEDLALPADVVLVPGVVGHATNVIEYPKLVADRIERFARILGPERVIAATDCGLGGRVHPRSHGRSSRRCRRARSSLRGRRWRRARP
jgi:5-methyltetrahydropteroyltriglutamate--homocysteine methyltransferase